MHRNVTVFLVALVVVAVGIGAFLNARYAADHAVPGNAETLDLVQTHSPVMGAETATVTIVEFFDPACEACRAFYPIVKTILMAYPDDVRLVLRYAPFHRGSDEAVRILHAARMQDRFEPVLEALLDRQPDWASHAAPNTAAAWDVAAAAGLDLAKARIEAFSAAADRVLERDKADTRAQRIQQTPTFLVNGRPLDIYSEQALRDLVRTEVEQSNAQRED